MERVILKYRDAQRAAKTLADILKEPYSIINRDATIQRFEYTFEALWKFLKEYLKEKEGVIENTPKSVFRAVFAAGFLSEEETVKFLVMTDRRNDTSHTYKEAVAEKIFEETKEYSSLIQELLSKFTDKLSI